MPVINIDDYVRFDTDDGEVQCVLCDTGWMRSSVSSHFWGQRHRKKVEQRTKGEIQDKLGMDLEVINSQILDLKRIKSLSEELDTFYSDDGDKLNQKKMQWVSNLRAKIVRLPDVYMYEAMKQKCQLIDSRNKRLGLQAWQDHVNDLLIEYTLFENRKCVDSMELALRNYERREIAALLELAVWKANRCDYKTLKVLIDFMELGDGAAFKSDFDPCKFILSKRSQCGTQFIIPYVLGFLY